MRQFQTYNLFNSVGKYLQLVSKSKLKIIVNILLEHEMKYLTRGFNIS